LGIRVDGRIKSGHDDTGDRARLRVFVRRIDGSRLSPGSEMKNGRTAY